MKSFSIPVQVRWSDMDPNFHLRHSVYYDWGAMCRVEFLGKYGLTLEHMQEFQFGPIIFREECVFHKEIRLGDPVTISLEMLKSKRDFSRWTISHTVFRDKDTVAAILTIEGAWLDTGKRKLILPPVEAVKIFSLMPLGENFIWAE
ncbi:MAG: acyl-CoA thioesterase [Chitinophagaceae bacterium]